MSTMQDDDFLSHGMRNELSILKATISNLQASGPPPGVRPELFRGDFRAFVRRRDALRATLGMPAVKTRVPRARKPATGRAA